MSEDTQEPLPQWEAERIYFIGDQIYCDDILYELKRVRDRKNMSIEIICFVPVNVN